MNYSTIANIKFNPRPTEVTKCSKLDVFVWLDSTLFVAGGRVTGSLQVECHSSRHVKLSDISVEFTGVEGTLVLATNASTAIISNDYESTQTFITSQVVFQGQRKPPTKAVHGPVDSNGYWLAVKRRTKFPFVFTLPSDLPSSFCFQRLASITYSVTGSVSFECVGKKGVLHRSTVAIVVENIPRALVDRSTPLKASTRGRHVFGGIGQIKLAAILPRTVYCAGDTLYIGIRVKNWSKKRVRGVRLALIRKLLVLNVDSGVENLKTVTETIKDAQFYQKEYKYDSGEERTTLLNIPIPTSMRTIHNTALSEVACFVQVSLSMGFFNKDLVLEFPISVYHPASIEPPPELDTSFKLGSEKYLKQKVPPKPPRQSSGIRERKEKVLSFGKAVGKEVVEMTLSRTLPWTDGDDVNYINNSRMAAAATLGPTKVAVAAEPTEYHIPAEVPMPMPMPEPAITSYIPVEERSRIMNSHAEVFKEEHSRVWGYEPVVASAGDGNHRDMLNILDKS